ncbi:MAG: hypothetical protein ACXAEU_01970 [Candidatus Hodarchaeales archaeon]
MNYRIIHTWEYVNRSTIPHQMWITEINGYISLPTLFHNDVTIVQTLFADIYIVTEDFFENPILGEFSVALLQFDILPSLNQYFVIVAHHRESYRYFQG